MKKFLALIAILATFSLTACGQSDSPSEDTAKNPEQTKTETSLTPFAEINDNIMDAKKDYDNTEGIPRFSFENGEGTCIDKGFSTQFSYQHNNALNYFVVRTDDNSYTNNGVGVDFTGRVTLYSVPFEEGEVKCTVQTSTGSNDAAMSCKLEDTEICTATYKLFADLTFNGE